MPLPTLALLLLLAVPPPGGRVVEEIVAVVRTSAPGAPARLVTRTKLEEEARVALVSRGATEAATASLDAAALRAALEWLVDQMLLAEEAERLRVDEVRREEVEAELVRFRGRFASPPAYRSFLAFAELSEEELLVTLARMVRVQRYVESRVGRGPRVTEEDVDRWLRERDSPGSPAARDAVRGRLVEERAEVQVKELLSELRGRADIRILGRLAAGEGT